MKIDEAIIRFVTGQDFVYDIDIAHYPMHKPKIFNNYKKHLEKTDFFKK